MLFIETWKKVYYVLASALWNTIPLEIRLLLSLLAFHKALMRGSVLESGIPKSGEEPVF